jgi:hypothetical protein
MPQLHKHLTLPTILSTPFNLKSQQLTPEQKQSELQKHRTILLTTLDYLEKYSGGNIVFDGYDPATEYYRQQKIQTEKYFGQRRLDKLQQQLVRLIKGLQGRVDLDFAAYIKEKTGFDIDIFEELRKTVDAIVVRKEIRGQKELNDVGTMLQFYDETADEKMVEKLKSLLIDYSERINETSRKSKGEYSEIISKVEKEGVEEVIVYFSAGPKPKHYEEQWVPSPDGKHKLRLAQWSDGKQASTYVAIHFANGSSGAVYALNGICPGMKAWWKDNATIVIETGKGYPVTAQHKQACSFDDVISIEYIEN